MLISLLINSLAIFITGQFLPGVHIDNFITAIVVALVFAVLNAILKPVLVLLTLPLTILTFGLFYFILNGLLVLLTDALIPGFQVDNIWWAILYSFIVSIINTILSQLTQKN